MNAAQWFVGNLPAHKTFDSFFIAVQQFKLLIILNDQNSFTSIADEDHLSIVDSWQERKTFRRDK